MNSGRLLKNIDLTSEIVLYFYKMKTSLTDLEI